MRTCEVKKNNNQQQAARINSTRIVRMHTHLALGKMEITTDAYLSNSLKLAVNCIDTVGRYNYYQHSNIDIDRRK